MGRGKEQDARKILPVIFAPLAAAGVIAAAPTAIAAGSLAADYTVYGMLKGAIGLGKAGQALSYHYLSGIGILESGTAASIYGGILDGFIKGASNYPNSEPYIVNDPRFQVWSDIMNGSISIFNHFREDTKKK